MYAYTRRNMLKRGKSQCSVEKTPLKRGAWSSEEDQKLIKYIKRYKIWNWTEMSKAAGLARSGKSCRLRWVNYLRPDIKHGNFSKEEEETIMSLHETLGNRWSSIAAKLPGRTDNEVKNFWHTHLKKRLNLKTSLGSKSSSFVEGTSPKKTPHSPNNLEGFNNTIIVESLTDQPMTTHKDICLNTEEESMSVDNFQQDQSSLAGQEIPKFVGDTSKGQTSEATFFDIGTVMGPSFGEAAWQWEDTTWPYDFYDGFCDSYWLDNMDMIF